MSKFRAIKPIVYIAPFILLLVVAYLFVTPQAEASGGIGSVTVSNVTSTSMVVSWNFSAATYTPSGSNFYKVCWKVSGSWAGTCSSQPFAFTENIPFTITGLNANTQYKIKVKCYCEKNTWLGGTKWRKVGTSQVTTLPLIATGGGSVWVSNSTATTLTASWNHSNPGQFAFWRVCYRKQSALFSLNSNCRQHENANGNNPTWGSGNRIGWANANTWDTARVFGGLRPCTQYKIVLYGFLQNNVNGTHIGTTNARTDGVCGLVLGMFRTILQDDGIIEQDYSERINAFYEGTTLFDHLAERYPELHEARSILLEDGDGDLRDTNELFAYLDAEATDILYAWQQEEALVASGLDIESFVGKYYPETYELWQQENKTNNDIMIWPTASWVSEEGETEIGCAYLDGSTECGTVKLLTEDVEGIETELLCQIQVSSKGESLCRPGGNNVLIIWPPESWTDGGQIGILRAGEDHILEIYLEDIM